MTASEHPAVEAYARHVNPAFVKLLGVLGYGRLLVRARDVWVWDHEGREYLDALAGFGSVNVGHNHPRLLRRLHEQLDRWEVNFLHTGPSAMQGELAARLATLSGLDVALFSNGGAEAVEAGLKLARAATGRTGLLSCEGGFHGTSIGALSVAGDDRLRAPLGPLLAGCERVPYGDLAALERALRPGTAAAFVVDPFNCEAGDLAPPPGWLAGAQALCRQHGTVLVLDEVQTGIGRTGTLFACQQEGFVPDVLVLAKALSGGLAPIGVTLTTRALQARAMGSPERFDLHASTFGGNALCCAAALETLAVVEEERLAQNARDRGRQLQDGLRARLAGHPLVRDIRGRGLLVGVELGPTGKDWTSALAPGLVKAVSRSMFGQWAAVKLLERGLLMQPASQRWEVLKLSPPLTIQPAEVDRIVDDVAAVLGQYEGVAQVVKDVGSRVGAQLLSGWSF